MYINTKKLFYFGYRLMDFSDDIRIIIASLFFGGTSLILLKKFNFKFFQPAADPTNDIFNSILNLDQIAADVKNILINNLISLIPMFITMFAILSIIKFCFELLIELIDNINILYLKIGLYILLAFLTAVGVTLAASFLATYFSISGALIMIMSLYMMIVYLHSKLFSEEYY